MTESEISKALHDIKQPLNVIRLASGNIRHRIAPHLDAVEAEYLAGKLARIDEQTERAAEQISELLTRFTSGK